MSSLEFATFLSVTEKGGGNIKGEKVSGLHEATSDDHSFFIRNEFSFIYLTPIGVFMVDTMAKFSKLTYLQYSKCPFLVVRNISQRQWKKVK